MDWLRFWEYTQADWSGLEFVVLALQFLVLAVAAIFALSQVKEAKRLREAQAADAKQSRRDARRLREDQAQPFVVVDFEVEQAGAQQIYLVISNIGRTMADNVTLTFEPELTSSFDSDPNVTAPRDLKPLRAGIPSLPPGKRIPVLFDVFTQRDADAYPDVYRVDIAFHARALGRDLSDTAVLDLGTYRNVLHVMRRDVHDVHERLKELRLRYGNGRLR